MLVTSIIIGVAVVAAGIICFFFFGKKKFPIPEIVIESLNLAMVIEFFKEPKRMQALQENKNNLAVAIREKKSDGTYRVTLVIFDKRAIFDKEKSEIVFPENAACLEQAACYVAKNLDPELMNLFGNNDMLILQ